VFPYSVLPKTQSGLDVNVRFGSIDGFRPGRESAGGELALFRLAGVSLVHGWLADVEDEVTWEAVVGKAGDYDAAVAMVAEGDSLASGMVVGADSATEEEVERCARVVFDGPPALTVGRRVVQERRKWTEAMEVQVRDGEFDRIRRGLAGVVGP
jgi:hypothetical protein